MELYIARDRDSELYLYNYLPVKDNLTGMFVAEVDDIFNNEIRINFELFPEVTWENSPQRVELKLIKNDSDS